ncbi:hypothetical protein HN011_010998 [Eciton burchellii]|nr:hypothetical protein HN011_010998 [Eciton burchellii]
MCSKFYYGRKTKRNGLQFPASLKSLGGARNLSTSHGENEENRNLYMRTLYTADKLGNAVKEMERLQSFYILKISETKWADSGLCHYNGTTFYYLDDDESNLNYCHGVRFLIKDSFKKYVKNVEVYSERIIILQLAETSINMNLIQVYAPTEISRIATPPNSMRNYAMRTTKRTEINIILGF